MIRFNVILTVLVVAGLVLGFRLAPTVAEDSPMTLVMTHCTRCHSTQRICNRLGAYDLSGWTETITTMLAKQDRGLLDDGEKARMANYLAQLPKGARPVCP